MPGRWLTIAAAVTRNSAGAPALGVRRRAEHVGVGRGEEAVRALLYRATARLAILMGPGQ